MLCQSFHLEILGHSEKSVELVLGNVHLAVVHERDDGEQLTMVDPFQIKKRVLVRVPFQDGSEERGASGQDHLVSFDLLVLTGQGHVEEVFVVAQFLKRSADVCLKIIPTEAKFLSHFVC